MDTKKENKIKLIDRLLSENEYNTNKKTEWILQEEIKKYPNSQILIGLSKEIRDLYLKSKLKLGDIAGGGTGISTGKDKLYLKKLRKLKRINHHGFHILRMQQDLNIFMNQFFLSKKITKNTIKKYQII